MERSTVIFFKSPFSIEEITEQAIFLGATLLGRAVRYISDIPTLKIIGIVEGCRSHP